MHVDSNALANTPSMYANKESRWVYCAVYAGGRLYAARARGERLLGGSCYRNAGRCAPPVALDTMVRPLGRPPPRAPRFGRKVTRTVF